LEKADAEKILGVDSTSPREKLFSTSDTLINFFGKKVTDDNLGSDDQNLADCFFRKVVFATAKMINFEGAIPNDQKE